MPTGTDTIRFIRVSDIPRDRRATYLHIVSTDRPQKTEPRRVRFTVGGDKINYPFDISTKTAGLITAKILINSVISTPNAKFMTMDIKDFYLCTPMARPEYMRTPVAAIPKEMMDHYNLWPLLHNGFVYCEINKGMDGLPQAGRIANDELVPYLAEHGYIQSKHTAGLFKHVTRPIAVFLVVDDFGVKYVGKEHALHLQKVLSDKYVITTDWNGNIYIGITLDWDYDKHTVDLSMPGYIERALARFAHPAPTRPEHAPHAWIKPQYGAPVQLTTAPDTSAPLSKDGIKTVQEMVGVLLYVTRAIENTMLVALGDIAAVQTKGTEHTAAACTKLLNYAATHPDPIIRFHASEMVLHIYSDASYLSAPQA